MTIVADPLEQLLSDEHSDSGDFIHWAFPPYEIAFCGAKIDGPASEGEVAGLGHCDRCLSLGALWVDHGIWEGAGPRPSVK